MATIQRFEDKALSSAYAKYRPVYHQHVERIISSYMRSEGTSGFDAALDVACGTGDSTVILCNTFKGVVGLDSSHTQIEQAKQRTKTLKVANVDFMVGDAHNLPIESSSIDLLTCSMGWHWLDAELFYAEAKRVLKPKGCLAVHGHMELELKIIHGLEMLLIHLTQICSNLIASLSKIYTY